LGLIDACISLCSHAVGVGNRRLAGQYIQIATILYTLCYIPIFVLWIFLIGPLFTWLGFDGKDDGLTREIGEQFTLLYLFSCFLKGVNTSAHALLDVIGKENYSTAFVSSQEVAMMLATLVAALQPGASDLNLVGLLLIAVAAAALIINAAIIAYYGWFDKFLDGMVGSFALLVRSFVTNATIGI
jgi:Na+-driven multidrug efflux pump